MIDYASGYFPYADEILPILYENLLRPRLIEEKMLILLRQGKLGKWFSGIGQEAISVGACMAMRPTEYILPMHRNLGVFTSRQVPLDRLISQFKGYTNGFTKGRDRSFHFGSREHRIVGMISHLGPQLAVADGIALASKLEAIGAAGTARSAGAGAAAGSGSAGDPELSAGPCEVTLVFCGEGSTSQGDFHEALNVAAVWNLPVIFVIENNGYGLSTPTEEQYKCARLADRGIGYGIEARRIDGNNILEVFDTFNRLAADIRETPRPVLIECMTFRMRGHEEASGTKYVPQDRLDEWSGKDPVLSFEQYLRNKGILTQERINELRAQIHAEIETAVATGFADHESTASTEDETGDLYAGTSMSGGDTLPGRSVPSGNNEVSGSLPAAGITQSAERRFIDAISDGLRESMERFPNLILMGQDIAEYGGAFKLTEGFVEQFGKNRVRNTPLCESAIVGIGLGLAIKGYKSVIEMQFADFVTMAFNQIVNNLAKTHYRWGQAADVVIRMPCGAGTAAGPFHSQTNEAWFLKTPGLKVIYPAFPMDAKGLLNAAIKDPNPVLFFEHKFLYRSLKGQVPADYFILPIGKGSLLQEGNDLSIITYGWGVHWAIDTLAKHPEIKADLIDLRTLMPWDQDMVLASVKKTGRAIILHEDTLTCGMGAEIASYLAEHAFGFLDAPILRCASLDTPIPASKGLENQYLASSRFEENLLTLWKY